MTARTRPIEPLSEAELQSLIRAASPRSPSGCRNRALIATAAYAGLRVGELLALRPKDLDLEAGEVQVLRGKGARQRTAALLPGAEVHLERWLRTRSELGITGSAPLFCTISRGGNALAGRMKPGRVVTRPYVHAMLQRLAARAGLEKRVHPHGLRHTHAHLLAERGKLVTDIRDQLGHSSLATTSRYLDSFAPAGRVARLRA